MRFKKGDKITIKDSEKSDGIYTIKKIQYKKNGEIKLTVEE